MKGERDMRIIKKLGCDVNEAIFLVQADQEEKELMDYTHPEEDGKFFLVGMEPASSLKRYRIGDDLRWYSVRIQAGPFRDPDVAVGMWNYSISRSREAEWWPIRMCPKCGWEPIDGSCPRCGRGGR
jgi:hypothetical protein